LKTEDAYNHWASTYNNVENKTRDLEGMVIRKILDQPKYERVLELGCGTGKNTFWLASKTDNLLAVDFSNEMMNIARLKSSGNNIEFRQSDLTLEWNFEKVNLITCSLVLEHIKNLDFIFNQAEKTLEKNGLFYICELHPYKQLQGSMARFEHEGGLIKLEYFIHHISEFYKSAIRNNFSCIDLQEWFDDDEKTTPRLVSFLFEKN
jgi:ubiquinone/menaquinone biosynthesis C-methylase UbiE